MNACAGKNCEPLLKSAPVVYLQHIEEPKLEGDTNQALVNWVVELRNALKKANWDKEQLREWVLDKSS